MPKQYHINPHLFFCIETDQILVWNYADHEQYHLTREYFDTLLEIARYGQSKNAAICVELLEGRLISKTAEVIEEWGFDELSKIFHIGISDLEMSEMSAEEFAKDYMKSSKTLKAENSSLFLDLAGEIIILPGPEPALLNVRSFVDVLLARKTYRSFTHQPVSLECLSTILFYSFGIPDSDPWPQFKKLGIKQLAIHKTSPSGGGRHPAEAFVIINHVQGLEQGIYHYQPRDHALILLEKGNMMHRVKQMNASQPFSEGLAFGLYIVAVLKRTWWKYTHSRAYRVVALDLGHVSQTFQLCATAANLNTWITGLFNDSAVLSLCHLSGHQFAPMLFVGAGISDGNVLGKEMVEEIKKGNQKE